MTAISRSITHHHLPIMGLGSGRTTLQDKFCSVMFAMLLEAGSTENSLNVFLQGIIAGTFDLGVEFALSKVRATSLQQLFPWYQVDKDGPVECADVEPGPEGLDVCQDLVDAHFGFDIVPDPEPVQNISLSHMLSVPGPLHILDNATNSLLDHMPFLRTAIPQLTAVSKFLSDSETTRRLLATCFSSPIAQAFHSVFTGFHAKVNEGRWGSIAFAVPEVLALQAPLRRFWNLDAFRVACQPGNQGSKEADGFGPRLEVVSESIESAEFWAQLQTLNILFDVVRELFGMVGVVPLPLQASPAARLEGSMAVLPVERS